jgi:hypothetical protein
MTKSNGSPDLVAYAGLGLLALAAWKFADLFSGPEEADDAPPPNIGPTLTRLEVLSIADALDWAFRGVTEDEGEVVRQLTKARNDRDIFEIVKAFGSRRLLFGLSGPYTLPAAVSVYLSANDIATINADYRAKGMAYSF